MGARLLKQHWHDSSQELSGEPGAVHPAAPGSSFRGVRRDPTPPRPLQTLALSMPCRVALPRAGTLAPEPRKSGRKSRNLA